MSMKQTDLDGAFLQYETTSYHDLLIGSTDMKVPAPALIDQVV